MFVYLEPINGVGEQRVTGHHGDRLMELLIQRGKFPISSDIIIRSRRRHRLENDVQRHELLLSRGHSGATGGRWLEEMAHLKEFIESLQIQRQSCGVAR